MLMLVSTTHSTFPYFSKLVRHPYLVLVWVKVLIHTYNLPVELLLVWNAQKARLHMYITRYTAETLFTIYFEFSAVILGLQDETAKW